MKPQELEDADTMLDMVSRNPFLLNEEREICRKVVDHIYNLGFAEFKAGLASYAVSEPDENSSRNFVEGWKAAEAIAATVYNESLDCLCQLVAAADRRLCNCDDTLWAGSICSWCSETRSSRILQKTKERRERVHFLENEVGSLEARLKDKDKEIEILGKLLKEATRHNRRLCRPCEESKSAAK